MRKAFLLYNRAIKSMDKLMRGAEKVNMSEEQKVKVSKDKLPTKTKIAVWWIFIFGIIMIIILISAIPAFTDWSYPIDNKLYLIPVFAGLFVISPSILLNFKNKLV
jgi:Trk-type K+ transport system membrane component